MPLLIIDVAGDVTIVIIIIVGQRLRQLSPKSNYALCNCTEFLPNKPDTIYLGCWGNQLNNSRHPRRLPLHTIRHQSSGKIGFAIHPATNSSPQSNQIFPQTQLDQFEHQHPHVDWIRCVQFHRRRQSSSEDIVSAMQSTDDDHHTRRIHRSAAINQLIISHHHIQVFNPDEKNDSFILLTRRLFWLIVL